MARDGKSKYSKHQVEKYVLVLKQLVQNCLTFLTNETASHSLYEVCL